MQRIENNQLITKQLAHRMFAAERQNGAPNSVSGVYGLVDPRFPERVRFVGWGKDLLLTALRAGRYTNNDHSPRKEWAHALRAKGRHPALRVLQIADVSTPADSKTLVAEWIERLSPDINVRLSENPKARRAARLRRHEAAKARSIESLIQDLL